MVRREMPNASSSAALANKTRPSVRTTATSVASRSNDWKRGVGIDASGGALADCVSFERLSLGAALGDNDFKVLGWPEPGMLLIGAGAR